MRHARILTRARANPIMEFMSGPRAWSVKLHSATRNFVKPWRVPSTAGAFRGLADRAAECLLLTHYAIMKGERTPRPHFWYCALAIELLVSERFGNSLSFAPQAQTVYVQQHTNMTKAEIRAALVTLWKPVMQCETRRARSARSALLNP